MKPVRPGTRVAAVAVAAAGALIVSLAGCAGTDAVTSGGTFQFVSPGGKTELTYPEGERKPVGSLAGPDLMTDGKTDSLTDFTGQIVVINTWGQWCGPCRGEAPGLERTYLANKDKGVAFLGINIRDYDKDAARDFVGSRNITYPSIYDPSMRTLIAFAGGGIATAVTPTTLILDRKHRVAAVYLKSVRPDDIQPELDKLIAEPQS